MRTILESTVRHRMSGGALQQMRREGFIPASVSARGAATQHCSVSRQKLAEILSRYGASALIELQGTDEGGSVLVISRDIQRDAVSGKLLHVGFQRLSARDPITADVRLTLVGQPRDVQIGIGTLE
jgi:large subunit ribosomal protein L25